jgi:homoserine dehydrogenase
MDELRIALLGFGSANMALTRMLLEKSEIMPPPPPPDHPDDRERLPHATTRQRRALRIPVAGPSGRDGGDDATRLVPWRIVCIVTLRHGRACVPLSEDVATEEDAEDVWEIDAEAALRLVGSGRTLDGSVVVVARCRGRPGRGGEVGIEPTAGRGGGVVADDRTDVDETLRLLDLLGRHYAANVVAEAIPSDPKGDGEPAISFIERALRRGMHVCSANKGPLAHRNDDSGEETYWKLQRCARDNGVSYQHESSVMDGVPLFSLWKHAMPHAKLTSIRGCLNGTTTVILSRMEGDCFEGGGGGGGGEEFHEALEAARRMGIVETDESLDVDGYDAAAKLRALLVVLSSSPSRGGGGTVVVPTMDEIPRDTIRGVTRDDLRRAYADGRRRYRLVATAKLLADDDDVSSSSSSTIGTRRRRWEACVRLELLPPSDPLYNLTGTDSSVRFGTDVLGPVTVVSSSPTLVDTAYGLFSDIARVASERI